jgi:hypothetical protein
LKKALNKTCNLLSVIKFLAGGRRQAAAYFRFVDVLIPSLAFKVSFVISLETLFFSTHRKSCFFVIELNKNLQGT